MMQSDSHKNLPFKKHSNLPIINRLISVYTNWQGFLLHFSKTSRFSLGKKIDFLFLEIIESIYLAVNLTKQEKLPYLNRANTKLDLLKFFLQIAWQIKAIDNKRYIMLSSDLEELGRMIGGWIRDIKKKLPPKAEE